MFEGLPRGPRRMSDSEVADHRRERLLGAMVAAVTRRGYDGVTLSELVGLAGISKSTFYEIFESKEECFWAAFEQIVEETAARAWAGYEEGGDLRERLLGALRAYGKTVTTRPAAASFVIVESLGLGTAGAVRRESGTRRFEALLATAIERDRGGGMSELEIRGTLGGARRVVYRRLREGRPEHFSEHAEELLDWALRYRGRDNRRIDLEGRAWSQGKPPETPAEPSEAEASAEGPPGWEEPPSSSLSRATLSQRERIMRAVAQLAGERGYPGLSVPAISGTAGVSNQTFYQEFAGKQEAFLAAFEALAERARKATQEAFERETKWTAGVGAGLGALLSFIAADPVLARFAFFELAAAGPAGRDASELATQRTMAFLAPEALPPGAKPLPAVVVEAIGGGTWAIAQHEIIHGRGERLPRLAPALLDFILAPLDLD